MMRSSILLILVVTVCIAIVSSDSEHNIVRIVNSGSTNTAGYTIELRRDGIVRWTVAHRRPLLITTPSTPSSTTSVMSIRLSSALTNSVFESVQAALPLSQFPPKFCIKSVSFGTSLHVIYNGEQSPDLNCPLEDVRLIALNKAIREVISVLQINTLG
ncbi:unnamed protein product [Rotaria sordida]|uniref:Uncharacterized protein n=1 Tax=Rotaria sordida TaxID=392033 RepID=A0A813YSN6_9BILA|nr:unnamed protein product [Rotaria sordida]